MAPATVLARYVQDCAPRVAPSVVFITSRRTLARHRDRLRRALAAIALGLRDTRADPEQAARAIAQAAETSDLALMRAQLRTVSPVFAPGLRLNRPVIERWASFDAQIRIVDRRPDVARAFDFSLLGG